MKTTVQNPVVLITGALAGIGRATAEALAELGATTVLVGRTQAKLEEAERDIRQVELARQQPMPSAGDLTTDVFA